MFIQLKEKLSETDTESTEFQIVIIYKFETHTGPVTVKYNQSDYEMIDQDPKMDADLHAFMRCASIMVEDSCTITQTGGA